MKNFKGIIYAIISSATFGLIPLFSIPLLRDGLSTPTILFYRMGIAALIIGLLALITKRNLRINFSDLVIFIALGFLYAVTSLGLLMSYEFIPSGVATTIHFLYPLVVTVIMIILFKEKSSIWLLLAAVLSLVGVAMLSWGNGDSANDIKGVLLVFITVVTYASYIVCVNKTRVARFDSLVVAFYVLLIATVMFSVYALVSKGGIEPLTSSSMIIDAFLLALLPTVLSNLTLVMAVKKIGSTTTSVLGSMEPLTAMLVGVFHFNEHFDLLSGFGMCLIVVSVIVVILQNKSKTSTQ